MEWIRYSEYNKPPQGLKIVCFDGGDVWVCRRLDYKGKDYWVEIPYTGNYGAILTDAPKYWVCPDYPEGFSGYMKMMVDEEVLTLDEFQTKYPKAHQDFVEMIINQAKNE